MMPVTLEVLQVARLIASLDVDVEAEAQWEQLAEERDAELDSGAVSPVSLEDAMARLRAGARVG